jgi:hypothetical protein
MEVAAFALNNEADMVGSFAYQPRVWSWSFLLDGGSRQTLHGAGDGFAGFGQDFGVVEVGGGEDDGFGAGDGFFALFLVVFDIERSCTLPS